jgi:2-aminoethylphosphonate dioxygenase
VTPTGTDDVVRRGLLDAAAVAALRGWVDEIESWPGGSHAWGHYAEHTGAGPRICRTENVSACHPGISALVAGPLESCASAALGEPAVAFKDKLNYKHPGGAGFSPHQDKLAYPGAGRVLSILVAVDACTVESGCLWMARGVDAVLPVDDRGVVRAEVAGALDWFAAELAAGDAVCIDGLAPHYSEANRAQLPRRVLVASYAPASEGYTRAEYYARRDDGMRSATGRDGRFRISTLADFEGTEVAAPGRASVCTHAAAVAR